MADSTVTKKNLGIVAGLLNTNKAAIEAYIANFATPDNLEGMRFWIQGELNRIQKGFTSTDSVVKLIAQILEDILNEIGDVDPVSGEFVADHRLLSNRNDPDQHSMGAITGLDADQQRQDTALSSHAANPNAHHNQAHLFYGPDHTDVDTTNPLVVGSTPFFDGTSWVAENIFSVAAYGGVNRSAPVAFDVTTGWTTLPLDVGLLTTPRGIVQIPGSNAIQYSYSGVYRLEISGIIQGFAEAQGGRTFFVRLYNNTDGAPLSADLAIGVGRNTADINFNFGTLVEVEGTAIDDDIIVQIGNGDAITGGTLTGGQLATFMIGEWRG